MNPLSSLLRSAAQSARSALVETNGRFHLLPDFLMIGTQRGGTTSLYNYLVGHPCIAAGSQKEIHFFDIQYGRGVAWYRTQFPSLLRKCVETQKSRHPFLTGEASPYYIFHPRAPQRIATLMPRVKLMALLRNPVDRAYSHYNWTVKQGYEKLGFEAALSGEAGRMKGEAERLTRERDYSSFNHQNFSYLARGVYADQLQVWFALFSPEHLFVRSSEAFFQDPARTVQEAFEFLGVPSWEPSAYPRFNEGSYRPMDPGTRRWLCEYFESHNKRLYGMLGVDFHWD